MRIGGLALAGFYLGAGALCHAIFIGTTFQASNLLSWGLLLAWPIALLVAAIVIGFFLAMLLMAIVALCDWFTGLPFMVARRDRKYRAKIKRNYSTP